MAERYKTVVGYGSINNGNDSSDNSDDDEEGSNDDEDNVDYESCYR